MRGRAHPGPEHAARRLLVEVDDALAEQPLLVRQRRPGRRPPRAARTTPGSRGSRTASRHRSGLSLHRASFIPSCVGDKAEPRIEPVRVSARLVTRELHERAAAAPGLADRPAHHGRAQARPALARPRPGRPRSGRAARLGWPGQAGTIAGRCRRSDRALRRRGAGAPDLRRCAERGQRRRPGPPHPARHPGSRRAGRQRSGRRSRHVGLASPSAARMPAGPSVSTASVSIPAILDYREPPRRADGGADGGPVPIC